MNIILEELKSLIFEDRKKESDWKHLNDEEKEWAIEHELEDIARYIYGNYKKQKERIKK